MNQDHRNEFEEYYPIPEHIYYWKSRNCYVWRHDHTAEAPMIQYAWKAYQLGMNTVINSKKDETKQSMVKLAEERERLAAQNAELIEVLKELDNRYCTVQPDMTKDERLEHRRTLIKVRTLLAKAEAV